MDGNNGSAGGGYLLLAIAFGCIAFGISRGVVWGLTAACVACVVLALVTAGGSSK